MELERKAIAARPDRSVRQSFPEVYLASTVGIDFAGQEVLFQHFVSYYESALGIPKRNMLILINSNRLNSTELACTSKRLFNLTGVKPATWSGQFDLGNKSYHRNRILSSVSTDAWIVNADADELHWLSNNWNNTLSAAELAAQAQFHGFLSVMGSFVDRVAPGALLNKMQPPPSSLWHQYPLLCRATSRITRGATSNVMLMHGSARIHPGYHWLWPSRRIAVILREHGSIKTECELPPHTRPSSSGSSNCSITKMYISGNKWHPVEGWEAFKQRSPRVYQTGPPAGVHRFKWTAAVEEMNQQRLQHYRGDDLPRGSKPRYWHFGESKNTLRAVPTGVLNVDKAGCVSSREKAKQQELAT